MVTKPCYVIPYMCLKYHVCELYELWSNSVNILCSESHIQTLTFEVHIQSPSNDSLMLLSETKNGIWMSYYISVYVCKES